MPVRVLAGPARGTRLMTGPRTQNYYWREGHEPAVPRALAQLLKPGHTFWDVGAHIGYVSLLGSRLVGRTGHLRAFEPLPANVRRLRQGVSLNAISTVSVHPTAVNDTNGLELRQHEPSLMWSAARPLGERVTWVTQDATMTSLGPPNLSNNILDSASRRSDASVRRMLSLVAI